MNSLRPTSNFNHSERPVAVAEGRLRNALTPVRPIKPPFSRLERILGLSRRGSVSSSSLPASGIVTRFDLGEVQMTQTRRLLLFGLQKATTSGASAQWVDTVWDEVHERNDTINKTSFP